MIFVENNSLVPQFNHAVELYLMDNYDDDIFMFWRNRPSILIGRFQNIHLEVNLEYTEKNNIDVVRRLSGGGAIYCDTENMQYSFITRKNSTHGDVENSFRRFAEPITESLQSLGLNAEFTGRNDIQINKSKISGNAQFHRKGKVLHHGTLLFKANMENITQSLIARDIKFKDREVPSIRSRVDFIGNHVNMSVTGFMDYIEEFIKKKYNISYTHKLNTEEISEIQKISDEIFSSHEWNYGITTSLNKLRNSEKYPFGIVETVLELKNGVIDEIIIEGDFFSEKGVDELCRKLKGLPPEKSSLDRALKNINVDKYVKGMDKDHLISDILKLSERG